MRLLEGLLLPQWRFLECLCCLLCMRESLFVGSLPFLSQGLEVSARSMKFEARYWVSIPWFFLALARDLAADFGPPPPSTLPFCQFSYEYVRKGPRKKWKKIDLANLLFACWPSSSSGRLYCRRYHSNSPTCRSVLLQIHQVCRSRTWARSFANAVSQSSDESGSLLKRPEHKVSLPHLLVSMRTRRNGGKRRGKCSNWWLG